MIDTAKVVANSILCQFAWSNSLSASVGVYALLIRARYSLIIILARVYSVGLVKTQSPQIRALFPWKILRGSCRRTCTLQRFCPLCNSIREPTLARSRLVGVWKILPAWLPWLLLLSYYLGFNWFAELGGAVRPHRIKGSLPVLCSGCSGAGIVCVLHLHLVLSCAAFLAIG